MIQYGQGDCSMGGWVGLLVSEYAVGFRIVGLLEEGELG